MRPCDSVAGTRCTRCTPPSYLRWAQTPCDGSVALRLDRDLHVLVAAEVALGALEELDLPALRLGVVHVHAQQVGGEQGALGAALAALDLHDHVTAVVGVARDEQAPQLLLGRRELLLERRHLLGEGLVLAGQLARGGEVVAGLDATPCSRRRSA